MHRQTVRVMVAVVGAAMLLGVTQVRRPAVAVPAPSPTGRYWVAPGLVREAYRWATPQGPVAVQLLRFQRGDTRVALRPELADGHVPGGEATHLTLRRLGDAAVAATNGGFRAKAPGPAGDPEGLFIRNGVYISNAALKGRGWRGAFALFPDRSYAVGHPDYRGYLRFADGSTAPISGLNRHPVRPSSSNPTATEITLLSRPFGATTLTPAGTVEVTVDQVRPALNLDVSRPVAAVRTTGNSPIPASGVVLAATGTLGARLARLIPGQAVEIELFSTIGWDRAAQAVAGGPLIVRDGQLTPQASWFTEGFGEHHNLKPHPRTVVGFNAGGEMLLVTIDGRQAGYSVGLTTAQTAHLMQHLGVKDAVMMDGGGSTTMAVDGKVVNRPSDRSGPRSVTNSFVVYSTVTTPHVTRLPGYSRYTVAANVARAGWPGGAPTVVLASGLLFPDGLAGGPLAARLQAPLLLTARDFLPAATATTLRELNTRDVVVLGGEAAVGRAVVDDLSRRGYRVHRIAGRDRTQTAAAVALRLGAPTGRVFLASASTWPDALSTTVPAARASAPLLTTWRERLSEHTAYALRKLQARVVVVVGGPAAVSDTVVRQLQAAGYHVHRIAGRNRYATSVALAEWTTTNTALLADRVVLATGRDFPDALVGGPFGARLQLPVVLSDPLDIDRAPEVRGWLDARPLSSGFLVGGRANLSTWVAHQLEAEVTD